MAKANLRRRLFLGVEAAFRKVSRRDGDSGRLRRRLAGESKLPANVCSDRTGHAEVVEVDYDLARVSYEQLLDVFWDCHDPTTPESQGPDARHAVIDR